MQNSEIAFLKSNNSEKNSSFTSTESSLEKSKLESFLILLNSKQEEFENFKEQLISIQQEVASKKDELKEINENFVVQSQKLLDFEEKIKKINEGDSGVIKVSKNPKNDKEKLIKKNKTLKLQIQEMNSKMQTELCKNEREITKLQEDLKLKTIELNQSLEFIKKTDSQSKKYFDVLRTLEDTIMNFEAEKKSLNAKLIKTEKILQQTSEDLLKEKKINLEYEKSLKNFDSLQAETNALKQQIFEQQQENLLKNNEVKKIQEIMINNQKN